MSNKEKQGFFRRIRSPLEHRTTSKHEEKQRSSSTSVIPLQQSNGHRRHGSDDVVRIENTGYGDPDILGSSNRSHSTGASPGDILNPPLPPRNPPKQLIGLQQPSSTPSNTTSGNMNDESPVYVAPADTLQRGGSGGTTTNNLTKGMLGNYTRAEPLSAPPSKNERKVMEMHQLTMSQRQRQDAGQLAAHVHGHQQQRVQVQNVDNSEYSTPFNLIQQQQQQKMANRGVGGGSGKGGSGASTRQQQRRVPQIGMLEENDQIIPVLSPPPGHHSDRSQTTSPSSPLSTPSSEHEGEGGSGGMMGGGGVSAGGTGDSDYDIPWDRKFRDFQLINRHPPNPKRQSSGGKVHHPDDGKEFHPHPSSRGGRRESPPQRSMHPTRGHSDRNSPPAPPDRNPPSSYQQNKVRRMSPQPPPEELLLSRPPAPRYLPSRHQSEQHKPRDGSTSPNQMMGGRYGGSHTIHGPHVPRDIPPEISPRTSSMSASHMSGRRLPSPPRERAESSPVVDRRGVLRPPSPPNPVHIDFSIPLCDQP